MALILVSIVLGGCASNPAWTHYRSAQTCHFKQGENCQKFYNKAIVADSKLPGLHSSFGAHLISKGKIQEGVEEMNIEIQNHPESKHAMSIVLKQHQKNAKLDVAAKNHSIE